MIVVKLSEKSQPYFVKYIFSSFSKGKLLCFSSFFRNKTYSSKLLCWSSDFRYKSFSITRLTRPQLLFQELKNKLVQIFLRVPYSMLHIFSFNQPTDPWRTNFDRGVPRIVSKICYFICSHFAVTFRKTNHDISY